jgi:hypothetical protein
MTITLITKTTLITETTLIMVSATTILIAGSENVQLYGPNL